MSEVKDQISQTMTEVLGAKDRLTKFVKRIDESADGVKTLTDA